MRRIPWIALLVVAVAGSARAQAASIDPGMNREEVIARLGKPVSEHASGARTYLYYSNGDEKKYGMHDLVALENGKVVDAVFRSSARKFNGKSSSPAAVPPETAIARGHGGRAPARPAPVEKKPVPPVKKEAPPAKKPEPQSTKKVEPPSKTPPVTKIAPPTSRTHEPLKGTDTRKIAPPAKAADSAKKGTPAPTKKP
ncbi:MAG: outer membrane protein assembly factor BamE [Gemmatimonadales bacterium]